MPIVARHHGADHGRGFDLGFGFAVQRDEEQAVAKGEFLVELISAMGWAAIVDEVRWISLAVLVVLSGVGTLVVLRLRKRRAMSPKYAPV